MYLPPTSPGSDAVTVSGQDAWAEHLADAWAPPSQDNVLAMIGKSRSRPDPSQKNSGTSQKNLGMSQKKVGVPGLPKGAQVFPAVSRWTSQGRRLIPAGPTAEEYIDHARFLAQKDASLGLMPVGEAWGNYLMMCDLGGWKPLFRDRELFLRCLHNLGYPERRGEIGQSGRARILNFNVPPGEA